MKKFFTLFLMLLTVTGMMAQGSPTEYQGNHEVTVGGTFGPYSYDNAQCIISQNPDGSLSLTIKEYVLSGTVIGDLYISDMTIGNIPYDKTAGKYIKDYTADNISVHIKAVSGGKTTMDADYTITKLGNVSVTVTGENAVSIVNNFQPGNMPFPIAATFSGKATTTGIRPPAIVNRKDDRRTFTIYGTPANSATRGIIIRNGKKYIVR